MSLYQLLKDRASINILKILHDNEVLDKRYCMSEWDLDERLPMRMNSRTIMHLEDSGLISAERTEDNGMVISITQKGKDFVMQFDKLISIVDGTQENVKAYKVEYDLADDAQRLLEICFEIGSKDDGSVGIRTIALEMFPRTDITNMLTELIEVADRLVELNLMERYDEDDEPAYIVTAIGERVVKEQVGNR